MLFEDAVAEKKAGLAELKEAESVAFENAVADAESGFSALKEEKLEHLDEILAKKLEWADAEIEHLKAKFVHEFLQTLYEIHQYVGYHERHQLIHKAVYKKTLFFEAIYKLREELSAGLADTRSTLVGELNDQWDLLNTAHTGSRNDLA